MACMEHRCEQCEWTRFDNTGGPHVCPKCGGKVLHYYDEPDDYDEPIHYRDSDIDAEEEEA